MSLYISVFTSDLNKPYWKAIQQAGSLDSLMNNQYYTAGINENLPKHGGDVILNAKEVTETATGKTTSATMIKRGAI